MVAFTDMLLRLRKFALFGTRTWSLIYVLFALLLILYLCFFLCRQKHNQYILLSTSFCLLFSFFDTAHTCTLINVHKAQVTVLPCSGLLSTVCNTELSFLFLLRERREESIGEERKTILLKKYIIHFFSLYTEIPNKPRAIWKSALWANLGV